MNKPDTTSPRKISPLSLFFEGAKDTFPLIVGAIPFGIIFGTLATTAGLSFVATMGMSMFVFAGASQFVCLSLLVANPLWKILLAFGLTDETFAVAVNRYNQKDGVPGKHYYNLGSMVFMYTNWNLCTIIGFTAGNAFPGISHWGLDFAMPATFIGIVIPYLVSKPMWASVITAGTVSIMAGGLPHKLGLMVAALAGVTAGVICEKVFSRKKELV